MKPRTASAGDGAAAQEIVVFIKEVAARVAGVGFPVISGPPIAAVTIESRHRRRIGFAKVEIQAIDVRRNRFRFCGIDGDGDIGTLIRWCRRRCASLRRICAFAGGVHCGDDVEICGPVEQTGVGEGRRCWCGNLRVRSAGRGAALQVITRRAGTDRPGERNLRVAGDRGETCWRCRNLRLR